MYPTREQSCAGKSRRCLLSRVDTIIENYRQQLAQELAACCVMNRSKTEPDGVRLGGLPSFLFRSAGYIPEGGSMLSAGKAVKVSIYLSEGSKHHGVPTYSSILDFLFYRGRLRRNCPEGDSRVWRGSPHAFRQHC